MLLIDNKEYVYLTVEILRQSDTVSEPLGMLFLLNGMPCLEVSGKVTQFSPSKLFWRLISSTVTKNLVSHEFAGVSASGV